MSTSRKAFRLALLALAALASVATSAVHEPGWTIYSTDPHDGETAVAATHRPSISLRTDEADKGVVKSSQLSLRTASGVNVSGQVVMIGDPTNEVTLRFEPSQPLAPGDYVLRYDRAKLVYSDYPYIDPATRETFGFSGGSAWEFRFSTLSRPELRSIVRDTNSEAQYRFLVSFSEPLDPQTVSFMRVYDATGTEMHFTQSWLDDELHTLAVTTSQEPSSLVLEPGLRAATGVEVANLPRSFDLPW